jgi:hypothetical protein
MSSSWGTRWSGTGSTCSNSRSEPGATPKQRLRTPSCWICARNSRERSTDQYLAEHGFTLLDLSEIDGLTLEGFEAGDHLSASGRALFMPLSQRPASGDRSA